MHPGGAEVTTILFDLDGTILDSESLSRASYDVGIQAVLRRPLRPEEAEYLVGKPFRALQDLFPGADVDEIVRQKFTFYEQEHHRIRPYPGVGDLLGDLRRAGYPLGIVTAKLRRYAHIELDQNGLLEHFSVVICQEDCRAFKPAPDPLLQAAHALDADPATCIYIGDQPTDMRAAAAARMPGVAALWGEGQADRLREAAPQYWANAPGDVLHILRGLATRED